MSDAPRPPAATIWARPQRSTRGPKAAHTRDEIAAVAVRVADGEGLDAVSMRRLANELGTGTTSLYRYFAKKDELLELMVDAAVGELPLPPLTGDWRADLRALAERERRQLKAHPWMLTLPWVRSMLGPNSLRATDHALAIVEDLGLDIDEMRVMVTTVLALTHGYVGNELADQEATRRSGMGMEQWMDSVGPYAETIMASGAYPRVVRMMIEAEGPHAPDHVDRDFEHGLDLMIDGLAASLDARRRPTAARG